MRHRPFLLKFYILLTVVLAMMLSVLPFPEHADSFRPAVVVLVVIFWTVYTPESLGLMTVWLIGILEDALHMSVLGEHALALVIVFYLVHKMHYQLLTSALWAQTLRVGFLVLINQLLIGAIQGIIGDGIDSNKLLTLLWTTTFTSMLIWPWMLLLLRELTIRQRLRVQG